MQSVGVYFLVDSSEGVSHQLPHLRHQVLHHVYFEVAVPATQILLEVR